MLGSKEPFDNPVFPRIFLQRLKVTSGHTRPWDEGGCVSLEPSSRNRTSRCRTAPERVKAGADSDFSRGKSISMVQSIVGRRVYHISIIIITIIIVIIGKLWLVNFGIDL